jgi:hypothetical protein
METDEDGREDVSREVIGNIAHFVSSRRDDMFIVIS